MKLLAIDIGASGGRAVIGEFSASKLRVSEIYRFPNNLIEVRGHKHWNILQLCEETRECLRRGGPDILSVGIDTWAVDYGYISAEGDLVGPPFAYRDPRTASAITRVRETIPPDKLYSITGIQHLPFNTIYQIADDLENRPWLVEKSHKLLMIPELLSYLLTGEFAAEYTNASTTALLDANRRCWSDEILKALGFPKERLAKLVEPGTLKVPLDTRISREGGPKAELIYPACHDTGSAIAAVPAEGRDWAFVSSGTWSLVGMELSEPVLTEKARMHNFTNEGGIAGTVRFLKNITGLWLIQELRRSWTRREIDLDFATISAQTERAAAFRSLIDPDHASFAAPADMQEAICEYCRRTGQPVPDDIGAFARCVFESLALACRRVLHQLREVTSRDIERLYVVGGGAQNNLLCQMTADACNLPLWAGPVEAAAIGNLLVQAMAHGFIRDISEARRLVAESEELLEFVPVSAARWEEAARRLDALKAPA